MRQVKTMADVHALVVAAGRGERFGSGRPKQYQVLAGHAVLEHAVRPFLDHPQVTDVTVVIAEDDGRFQDLSLIDEPRLRTALGGPHRSYSVLNGLHALAGRGAQLDSRVLVHDGARPCVSREEIDAVLALGEGILVAPVVDSLKRCDPEVTQVTASVDRRGLRRALTPQCFELGRLSDALSAALVSEEPPGDEAEAIERAGGTVLVTEGSGCNIKITTAEDLRLAEAIFAMRAQG
jgi:2-C-methyl-D-erythritol 4-phosphate cytidylyltransferase